MSTNNEAYPPYTLPGLAPQVPCLTLCDLTSPDWEFFDKEDGTVVWIGPQKWQSEAIENSSLPTVLAAFKALNVTLFLDSLGQAQIAGTAFREQIQSDGIAFRSATDALKVLLVQGRIHNVLADRIDETESAFIEAFNDYIENGGLLSNIHNKVDAFILALDELCDWSQE